MVDSMKADKSDDTGTITGIPIRRRLDFHLENSEAVDQGLRVLFHLTNHRVRLTPTKSFLSARPDRKVPFLKIYHGPILQVYDMIRDQVIATTGGTNEH
jgi:hypothetical protein